MKLDQATLAKIGLAALQPGMRYMMEVIEAEFAQFRSIMEAAQNGTLTIEVETAKPRRGRPPKQHTPALPALLEAPNKGLHKGPSPERIGHYYTRTGAAKYMGVSLSNFDRIRKMVHIPVKTAMNPAPGKGKKNMVVFTEASLDKAMQKLEEQWAA